MFNKKVLIAACDTFRAAAVEQLQTLVKKNNKINTKTYKTISKEKQLDELIKKLNEKSVIAVDTETSSLNPQDADLVGISVCYEANEAFYIPVGHKKRTELKKDLVL